MRILVCSLEAPLPPPNGLRRQVTSLVSELRRDHDVAVLGMLLPDQTTPDGQTGAMRLVPQGTATSPARAERLLREPLREELERFRPDVVHVTSGRLAGLGKLLHGRPAVLAALDAWHLNVEAERRASRGLRRALKRGQVAMVRRFERREFRRFGRIVVVSEEDRQALLRVEPALNVEVVPNGVDADLFDWDGATRDRDLIVFTGVMSYAPNVTAAEFLARRVFPLVQRREPDARLMLIGRDPGPLARSLGTAAGIEVVGEVPDLRPWLSRAGVFVCPMRSGTGIKNKLLEAMANGLPSVVTPLSLQGLSASPGEHLLVGYDEAELAGQVVRLMRDRDLRERVGAAGQGYVRRNHSWARVADEFVRIYRQVSGRT